MRQLRKILFPFSAVYYVITLLRNFLYARGILSSKKYDFPLICVGNLSTGGTGKTPMTEYILRLLKDRQTVATLSRGYGRNTKGYITVTQELNAGQVGDEPLQFARKFPNVFVAVCEDRQEGIAQLKTRFPSIKTIILDDAFQHRKVVPSYSIVLTSYNDLYSDDFVLPAGNLREPRSGANRADCIVITKCPSNLSKEERSRIEVQLRLKEGQSVYFSYIRYNEVAISKEDEVSLEVLSSQRVTLVTGIANPKPLLNYLKGVGLEFKHRVYSDHHTFAPSEIEKLDNLECILTTEKDYMRLLPELKKAKLYYLPIQLEFVDDQAAFDKQLLLATTSSVH